MNTFKDERGEIVEVAEGDFKEFLMISSKKGSIRANHYHLKGGHLCYIVSGKMRYAESDHHYGQPSSRIVGAGEAVFTGPIVPHAMEFLEDTLMVCLSTLKRSDGDYEKDLVRVKVL